MASQLDRRTFRLCWLVTYFSQTFVSMFFLYPVAIQQQGFPFILTGWLMSIFSVTSTLVRPFSGIITERIGVRKSLLIASIFLFASSLPLLWVQSFSGLMILRACMGFFYGIVMVAITTYQALSIPADRRGRLYAWIAIAYVLPLVTILPIAEFSLSRMGTSFYLILAPLLVLALIFSTKYLPRLAELEHSAEDDSPFPHNRNQAQQWGSWKEMFSVPGFWPLMATLLTWSLVNSSTLQYMPSLIHSRGMIASAFMMTNAAVSLFLRFLATGIMDRIDRTLIGSLSIALMGAVVVGAKVAFSNQAFCFLGAIYGIGMGMGFPVMLALMPDIFPRHLQPKGVAAGTLLMEGGFIITPFIMSYGGFLWGLENVLALMGAFGCANGLFLAFKGWRRSRR